MRRRGPLPPDLDPALLEDALGGTRFVGCGEAWAVLDSTIARASELADEGAPEGSWVVADWQRAGRGQHGRTWLTPPEVALALTVVLRPALAPERLGILTKLAGLAAARACRVASGLAVHLKAPNDLIVRGADGRWRKLGGVLVDTAIQGAIVRHALLSFGVNVRLRGDDLPPELRDVATSLAVEQGESAPAPSRSLLLASLLAELERTLRDLVADEGRLEAEHSHLVVDAPNLSMPHLDGVTAPEAP